MSDWVPAGSGDWPTAASWTGGLPNAAGAVANFVSASTTSTTGLVTIGTSATPSATITVGTLNISTQANFTFAFTAYAGATSVLRMQGAGGSPAFINVDSNGSTNVPRIVSSANFSLTLNLASDLILTTQNADSAFRIEVPVTGAGELAKYGDGTLTLNGASTFTGGLRINAGTAELGSMSGAGGGVVTIRGGAALRFTQSGTFTNAIETSAFTTGSFTNASILAATGTTVTLNSSLLSPQRTGQTITLGNATNTGILILSAQAFDIPQNTQFSLSGGTVRFGNTSNAAGLMGGNLTGSVALNSGATIDTGGFATTLSRLDGNGGTIRSSTGVLDLTLAYSGASALNQQGTIIGTSGADRIVVNGSILDLGGGATQLGNFIDLSGWTFSNWNSATDTITISSGENGQTVTGTSQNDTILGNGGDDVLNGGGGIDTLVGGTGNDTYQIDTLTDTLTELANEGIDTVVLLAANTSRQFNLAANFENLTFQNGLSDQIAVGNALDNIIIVDGPHASVSTFGGNDRIVVTSLSPIGSELQGGTGNDTYVVGTRETSTLEFANEGIDTVETTSQIYVLQNHIENLTFTSFIQHAGAGNELDNVITGFTDSDELFGRAGNDTLDGGTGAANTMLGESGDDTYIVRVPGDTVFEFANDGIDTVRAAVANFVLPNNVENLIFTSAGAHGGVGNALDNVITGFTGADDLNGGGGNDVITGGSGADLLQGGSGADQFRYLGGETGMDRILDFVSGTDKIALSTAGFARTATVAFVSGVGAVANTANSTFLYDPSTGIVSYDADGIGAGLAVQLAQLNGGQTFVATDCIFV